MEVTAVLLPCLLQQQSSILCCIQCSSEILCLFIHNPHIYVECKAFQVSIYVQLFSTVWSWSELSSLSFNVMFGCLLSCYFKILYDVKYNPM